MMLVVKGIYACLRKLKINHTIPITTVFYAYSTLSVSNQIQNF